MLVEIRDYEPADEQGWLRCRVLSFLGTAYFDDVMTAKGPPPPTGAELVAAQSGEVIGLLDLRVDSDLATVTTIAVHPDHQRQGVGTALLETACARAKTLGASMIEAWTRDDQAALGWYRSRGFSESGHYLHVYADHYTNPAEPPAAVAPGLDCSPSRCSFTPRLTAKPR
jgi:ribosomal protein S18 acetylase RimI-like enzyme